MLPLSPSGSRNFLLPHNPQYFDLLSLCMQRVPVTSLWSIIMVIYNKYLLFHITSMHIFWECRISGTVSLSPLLPSFLHPHNMHVKLINSLFRLLLCSLLLFGSAIACLSLHFSLFCNSPFLGTPDLWIISITSEYALTYLRTSCMSQKPLHYLQGFLIGDP